MARAPESCAVRLARAVLWHSRMAPPLPSSYQTPLFIYHCERSYNRNYSSSHNKVEHTIDRCFDIIGYPPVYVKNPDPRTFNANFVSSSNEKGASLSFTNGQMMKLMNLINESPSGSVQDNMAGWIIDSGANQHMTVLTSNMFGIIDVTNSNLTVGHPNRTLAKIQYARNLKLYENIVIYKVLLVPEYYVSLLSVNKLNKDTRMFVGFTETKCFIQDLHQNKIVGTGGENGGLYIFDYVSPISFNSQTLGNQSTVCYVSKFVWHTRLGQPSDQAVDMLHQDLNFTNGSHVSSCDIGYKANQTRDHFPFTKTARSDNGTEFVNNKMNILFDSRGIVHQTSCAYTPQQNGIAERKHRHLLNVARSLLFQSGIPLIYVDDIVITGNDLNEIEKFKVFRKNKFQIKDLGKLKYFLGIKVLDNTNGICFSQRKYCLELLNEFRLLAGKPVETPLPEKATLNHIETDDDYLLASIGNYQRLIGKLIYLTKTRPNISYVVHRLSQFMHSSINSHLDDALRVLRYLKGSLGSGVQFNKNGNLKLRAYADSDWARCPATR
uniref:Ribonuclease H-like domain-containing protein n=1 Tax=Tanacetum cinerariifolium TaxID=118510 RepID=A0A699GZA4_TANCI|nr:ribonuclease H-like domain-containing protein [Tanacetum cinerariifolium]